MSEDMQRYIFTCSVKQRMLQMFSLQSGKYLGECPGHKNGVWVLHRHDGKRFYSGARDKRIVEWRIEDELKHRCGAVGDFSGHQDWIRDICSISPTLIASCSDDKYVKLWNVKTRWSKTTTRASNDEGAVTKIVPLGKTASASVVAGTENGMIHQFDLKTTKVKCSWKAHENSITGLVYSSTRRSLIFSCGQYSDVILVWDARLPLKSEAKSVGRMVSHTNEIWDINFQNNCLYTAAQDGSIKEWNSAFQNSRTWKSAHGGHCVYSLHALHEDIMLSGGDDRKVRKWNLETGKQEQEWESQYAIHDVISF